MLAGLFAAAVLILFLWESASWRAAAAKGDAGTVEATLVPPWRAQPQRWKVAVGAVLSFATSAPTWRLAPWAFGNPATFWADDASHATVAAELVAHGLPHGWVERYYMGFPVGHHYPIGGWAALSSLIALGISPQGAASLLGWLGVALVPLSFYAIAVGAGARPSSATVGAAFIAWVSPYNAFVGGFEVYYSLGLISQVVGLHAAMLMIGSTVGGRRSWSGPLAAALAMMCHPQVGIAGGVVLGVALLASGTRTALVRGARTLGALFCAGAALYGQGIATLRVPFGWPPGMGWRHVGFAPSRLRWWMLDGDLFDQSRQVHYLTAVAAAAMVSALLRSRRPVPRSAGVAMLIVVPLSVSGEALLRLGSLGQALLSVLQPLRLTALLPVCAAGLVAVALEETAPAVGSLLASRFGWRFSRAQILPSVIAMAALAPALSERFDWAEAPAHRLALMRSRPCGEPTPRGYDSRLLRGELGALTGGRLWYAPVDSNRVVACATAEGLDHSTSVPIAASGAVGAHVGFVAHAMSRLRPEVQGSAARAEALGVRYLLLNETDQVASGWRLRASVGGLRLYENIDAVQLVGAGCVRETWRGTNRELAAKLHRELETPEGAARLLDPEQLTALEQAAAPLTILRAPDTGCSPQGARIVVHPREPGAVAATIDLAAPADIVFRMTAFPSWRVILDGAEVVPHTVSPGAFAVRAPPGHHPIEAVASTLPGYGLCLALGALGIALAAMPSGLIRQRVPRR